MVRINLVEPKKLTDQHLVAEFNETLMLFGQIKKCSTENIPKNYCLGTGHIRFFFDKLVFLKKRFEKLKREMIKRGFRPTKELDISGFEQCLQNDWIPSKIDIDLNKKRIRERIRQKPDFYRYYGKHKDLAFLLDLLS